MSIEWCRTDSCGDYNASAVFFFFFLPTTYSITHMSFSPQSLLEVMQHNKEQKRAVSRIIESNPQNLPLLPKLIVDPKGNALPQEIDRMQINRGILENIHHQIQTNRTNNKNIIKLFPDIEMSIQILVSSILSPKKMTDIALTYKLGKNVQLPPTLTSALLAKLQEYLTETYGLEEKLPEMVREALFSSGSYVMAVVPEASVDETVNADLVGSFSTEAFKQRADQLIHELTCPINVVGSVGTDKPLSERVDAQEFVRYLAGESLVRVTDNPGVFHFSVLKEKIAGALTKRSYRGGQAIAQESREKIQYLDIFRRRDTKAGASTVTSVRTRDDTRRESLGAPMVMRIPSESAIPVSVPGNESEHIGYLVLLDESGKPLNAEHSYEHPEKLMQGAYGASTGAGQTPVQIAYRNLVADTQAKVDTAQLFAMYKDVLENQLYASIQGSLSGKNVTIANKNDIYFLMFSRALAAQRTSVLFIPQELVCYLAFYYDEYGVGKSILDNLSILCSLRSILLFARVMAQAKSAIDVTKVNVQLSPEDPDPQKTISIIQDGVLKLRQNFFPLGINNPVDLINWIQRAGLQFAYSNNPLVPDVKIDFENANTSHTEPNSELEENLRKQTFQAMGLPPETIDNAFSPDFATNVVNNNILLSKRVLVYQKALCNTLNKLVGALVYNDEELRKQLGAMLIKSKGELMGSFTEEQKQAMGKDEEGFIQGFLDQLSESILVELPKPENTNLLNLTQEFEVYRQGLEQVIESVVSSEIFSEDLAGEMSAHIDTIKSAFKHHLVRKWCADNNYYPEALALANTSDQDIDALITALTNHLTGTMRNGAELFRLMEKFKKAIAVDLAGVDGEAAPESTPSSGDSSGYEEEEESGEGSDEGSDDMSLDF